MFVLKSLAGYSSKQARHIVQCVAMDDLRDLKMVQKKQTTICGVGLFQRWSPMAANIIVIYLTSWVNNFNFIGMICILISLTNVTLFLKYTLPIVTSSFCRSGALVFVLYTLAVFGRTGWGKAFPYFRHLRSSRTNRPFHRISSSVN